MATIDRTPRTHELPEAALEEVARAIGPLRNPDDCVLACPDCTCARLLEQRRACEREQPPPGAAEPG
jgi:hypothetical protein